ncbi:MAG: hypothetical protein AMXMBFR84_29190 [Candidatus Hydrogenedentota bacterium]
MDIHIRKSKRSLSLLLPATFLVGVAIGFTLCYALYAPSSAPEDDTQVASGPETAPVDAPPPATETAQADMAEPVAPTEPAPAEPAQPETTAAEYLDENQAVWPARHLFIAVKGSQLDRATRDMLGELKPGGVVLTKDNISNKPQTNRLVTTIKEAVGFGTGVADLPLIAVDQEGGPVNRLRLRNTTGAAELGKKRDPKLARELGSEFANACESRGIGILLAPVLDVAESGTNKNLTLRTFGDDSKTVTSLGLSFAAGVMDGKDGQVLPVVKHFPGHGAVAEDTHAALAVMKHESKDLPGVFFPFSEAARAGIPGIMVGHIAVPSLDTENPNRPASLSPKLIKELIRERWMYEGVVLSDDLAMGAIGKTMNAEEAAVKALVAGCDAVIMLETNPERVRAVCKAIEDAVAAGTLAKADLARSKQRLDQWQIWLRSPSPLKGEVPPLPEVQVAQVPAEPTEPAPATEAPTQAAQEPVETAGEIVHVVKKGDLLGKIATQYNVSVKEIQEWNNKKDTRLNIGDKLVIRIKAPTVPEPAAPAPETPPAPEATVPNNTPETANVEPVQTVKTNDVVSTPPAQSEPAPETASPPAEPQPEPVPAPQPEPAPAAPPAAMKKVQHTIAPGEFPNKIAQKYSVSVNDLFKWNGIADGRIRAGDTLIVYVPMDAPFDGEAVTSVSDQPAASEPAAEPVDPPEEATVTQPADTEEYTVAPGDSLVKIAAKFNTTRENLVELNKLDNPNRLRAGQKLFVPKKSP